MRRIKTKNLIRNITILNFNILLLTCLISCKNASTVNFNDYRNWIFDPKNGLTQSQLSDEYKITITYLTSDYLDYFESINNESEQYKNNKIYSSERNSLTWMINIQLIKKISSPKSDRLENFDETSLVDNSNNIYSILTKNINEFIMIESDHKLIYPILHSVENYFNINATYKVLLVFDKEDLIKSNPLGNEINIKIKGQPLKSSDMNFLFSWKDINNIPSLNQ